MNGQRFAVLRPASGAATLSRTVNGASPCVEVALVGRCLAMPVAVDTLRAVHIEVQRYPDDVRPFKEMVASRRPGWLLIGDDVEETKLRVLVQSARAMRPDLPLAMLGSTDDLRRCERWLRRGCRAYMVASSELERIDAVLSVALALQVLVVDCTFSEVARARVVQPVASLTRREEEVLQLLCEGQRNADIARCLHLTENTVEFHVSRLLVKLGARNRVEALDRALSLGLV